MFRPWANFCFVPKVALFGIEAVSLFPAVTILWVLSFCMCQTLGTKLHARHKAPHNPMGVTQVWFW